MTAARVGGEMPRHVRAVANIHGSVAAAEELSRRERRVVGPLDFHCEPGERLLSRLDQADALLCAVTGEGLGGYLRLNQVMQEAYLQAVCDLVSAARVDAWVLTHSAPSTNGDEAA